MTLPLLLAAALLVANTQARAQDITIYRCTDAKGRQTLSDSPCKHGEKQQAQQRLRPRDAPRASATPASSAPPARATETVRYVIQPAARPLYACIAPDGRRYTSASPEGAARWVPGWAMDAPLGVYPLPAPPVSVVSRVGGEVAYRGGRLDARIGGGREIVIGPSAPAYPYAMGGMWVRDACSEIPPAEACAVLAERRSEISQGYYHAMPSERQRLDRESATLDARLAQECSR